MPGKFVISISCAKNDTDKATVGFVIANADDIHEEGFAPLKELMTNFAAAGGTIYVCSPCFKKRALDETALVDGAKIVGGAKLVEFMSEGAPSISY
jgi:predicted peroxiredoxin